MSIPTNLVPLVDGDILRYEVGFGAESGWKAMTGRDEIPPFDYVENLLLLRLRNLKGICQTKLNPIVFITEGQSFRHALAKSRPYKGNRVEKKPWHYQNLTVYIRDVLNGFIANHGLEADDMIAATHIASRGRTIICSRDKDLKQVPGWFHSWELGRQPSFGPALITGVGELALSEKRDKLLATGLRAFYGQLLTGDRVDNIPGLPGWGPVQAYNFLKGIETPEKLYYGVRRLYEAHYDLTAEEHLLEQGRLCWMTRRIEKGQPVLWELGMES